MASTNFPRKVQPQTCVSVFYKTACTNRLFVIITDLRELNPHCIWLTRKLDRPNRSVKDKLHYIHSSFGNYLDKNFTSSIDSMEQKHNFVTKISSWRQDSGNIHNSKFFYTYRLLNTYRISLLYCNYLFWINSVRFMAEKKKQICVKLTPQFYTCTNNIFFQFCYLDNSSGKYFGLISSGFYDLWVHNSHFSNYPVL